MRTFNVILIIVLLFGCTEEIDIPINMDTNQIVVQGFIESGETAKIQISKNFPVNQSYTLIDVWNAGISNAIVTLTNSSGISEQLLEVNGEADTWRYNYVSEMEGVEGESYLLEINHNGTYLWAVTTIPKLEPIDTTKIKFIKRPTEEGDPAEDCFAFLRLPISDPDTIGNCWKISSKRCWDDSFTPMAGGEEGHYNDEYINSWNTTIDLYPGIGFWASYGGLEENQAVADNSCFEPIIDGCSGATDAFWGVGEPFQLKFSAIDRASWDFWVSLLNNNPGNPFGSPSQANSNVIGGLGVFSGLSSQYLDLIADPDLE